MASGSRRLLSALVLVALLAGSWAMPTAHSPASGLTARVGRVSVASALSAEIAYTVHPPPVCAAGASVENVTFDGSATGGQPPYLFVWTFPNTSFGGTAEVNTSVPSATALSVELTVQDAGGAIVNASTTVPAAATQSVPCPSPGTSTGASGGPGPLYWAVVGAVVAVAALVCVEAVVVLRRRR